MLVSVAFDSSTTKRSPLSGVMRFITNASPSARRLSILMARKLRKSSVDIARITSGLDELATVPCGMPERSS